MTCDDGWKGAKCDQPCGDGTWGADCAQNCEAPANCAESFCDPLSGEVTCSACKAGFTGAACAHAGGFVVPGGGPDLPRAAPPFH